MLELLHDLVHDTERAQLGQVVILQALQGQVCECQILGVPSLFRMFSSKVFSTGDRQAHLHVLIRHAPAGEWPGIASRGE